MGHRGNTADLLRFRSTTVKSPAETVDMISGACAELGERALICSGWSNFSDVPTPDHVKASSAR